MRCLDKETHPLSVVTNAYLLYCPAAESHTPPFTSRLQNAISHRSHCNTVLSAVGIILLSFCPSVRLYVCLCHLPFIWNHTALPVTRRDRMCLLVSGDLTQVNTSYPALTAVKLACTEFTYPEALEGWVDLGDQLHTEMVYPHTDGHPSKY